MSEEQKFKSVFTPFGKEVAANAYNGGERVQIAYMGIGDGGGEEYTPEFGQEDLRREWLEISVNNVSADDNNPFWLVTEGIIPENIGGNWIREVSIKDTEHRVIALASVASTYKPTLQEGSTSASIIRIVLAVNDSSVFELTIDTSIALVTRDEFTRHVEKTNDVHGASYIAKPSSLVQRDSEGRFEAGEPTEPNQVARLAEINQLEEIIETLIPQGNNRQVMLGSGLPTPKEEEGEEEVNAPSSLFKLAVDGDALDYVYGEFMGKACKIRWDLFGVLMANELIDKGLLDKPDWNLITSIKLSMDVPVNGEAQELLVKILDDESNVIDDANFSAGEIVWEPSTNGIWNGTQEYLASFSVIPKQGYFFINPIPILINNDRPYNASAETDGSWTLTKNFPATMTANPKPDMTIPTPAFGIDRPATATKNDAGNYSVAIEWSPEGSTYPAGVSVGTFTLSASEGYRWNSEEVSLNGITGEGELSDDGMTLVFEFYTENISNNAGTFTDSRDGKIYPWKIMPDGKKWMTVNFDYNQSGSVYMPISSSGTTPGNAPPFEGAGRLYTWDQAVAAAQGVGDGWRLPSENDWTALALAAGGTGTYGNEGVAGTALKSVDGWNNNGNGNDTYGFSGRPGGNRNTDSTFNLLGNLGYWWSSTADSTTNAINRQLYYNNAVLSRYSNPKAFAFSVRLCKD